MNETFLDSATAQDPALLRQVRLDCEKLLELRAAMMIAEDALEKAKKAYAEFASEKLPQVFKDNGLDMLTTADGVQIRVVTKTRASIKKGSDDGATSKESISQWLRAHNADHLIKEQLIVPQSQMDKLKENGISFKEDISINTNSLKALIVDMLGQNGGVPVINKDDIPAGLSFYQWDEAEVS